MLLHRFQEGGLRLGRRAVDLVGQDHVGEDRPLHELHPPPAFARFLEDLRAGDVRRHQVGRELNPLKLQVEDLRDRADEQGLRQPGRTGDQAMTAGKQADQELMRRLLLADDHLGKLALDPAAALVDLLDGQALVVVGIGIVRHDHSFQTSLRAVITAMPVAAPVCRSVSHRISHDLMPIGYDFFSEISWK